MDRAIIKIPLYKSQAEAFINRPHSVEGRGIGRVISREVKKRLPSGFNPGRGNGLGPPLPDFPGQDQGPPDQEESEETQAETGLGKARKYSLFIEYGADILIGNTGKARLEGRVEQDLRDNFLIPPEVKQPLQFSKVSYNPDTKKNEAVITIIVHE